MTELLKCDGCGEEIVPYSTAGHYTLEWQSGISANSDKHFHTKECIILWIESAKK